MIAQLILTDELKEALSPLAKQYNEILLKVTPFSLDKCAKAIVDINIAFAECLDGLYDKIKQHEDEPYYCLAIISLIASLILKDRYSPSVNAILQQIVQEGEVKK